MNVRSQMIVTLMLLSVLLLGACGGKGEAESSQPAEQPAAQQAAVVEEVQGDATKGQELYSAACVACHGPDAQGVAALGKSLHASESEFVSSQSDEELVQFIKVGRQPDDPANTTGVAMPPKGGNPAISDDDLRHIVAWLRTLE